MKIKLDSNDMKQIVSDYLINQFPDVFPYGVAFDGMYHYSDITAYAESAPTVTELKEAA